MRLFVKRPNKPKPTAFLRTLKTERLVLRAFELSDALDVFAYAKSLIVGPMAGFAPHRTLAESQAFVRKCMESGDVWAIVEKKMGRVIGSIGLRKDSKRNVEGVRMLGYALGEDWWGQGYATEAATAVLRYAFEELSCPLVSVFHYPQNEKSKRVIQKLGFSCEGHLRMSNVLSDGRTTDEVCYSMTREEYER